MQSTDQISVLVPALNEEDTIGEVIERLLALGPQIQIVVVDDGSTDRTPEILERYRDRITVHTRSEPKGKGNAIREGLPLATGRVIIIQDADLEYFPEQIPMLAAPIIAGVQKVVYGTRFAAGMPAGMALPNKIVNLMLAWTTRLFYRQRITDEATCYKALDAEVLRSLELECVGFEFCPEVTAKVSRSGHKIHEMPIDYKPRNVQQGKKIRWTDAPIAFWTLLKYLFWRPRKS